jgi:hypothetical protein
MALLGLYAVYGWASSQQVSGRVISGEARLGTWETAWSSLSGWERLFGAGLGTGTNALVALVGYDAAGPAAVSDSAFVAAFLSLGLLGLAGYLAAYLVLWRVVAFEHRFALLPMLGLALVTFNAVEVSPFNVLVALTVGAAATGGARRASTVDGGHEASATHGLETRPKVHA